MQRASMMYLGGLLGALFLIAEPVKLGEAATFGDGDVSVITSAVPAVAAPVLGLECEYCYDATTDCSVIEGMTPGTGSGNVDPDLHDSCSGEPPEPQGQFEIHIFEDPPQGMECDGENPAEDCVTCGGESLCHQFWMHDGCHPNECNFNLLARMVEEGIADRDAVRLASLLTRDGVTIAREGSTMNITAMCGNRERNAEFEVDNDLIEAMKAASDASDPAASDSDAHGIR